MIGRRGFLGQLAILPLIGGSVKLIGQPSAVAEPVSLALLQNYNQWLWGEHSRVGEELATRFGIADARFKHVFNEGAAFHSLPDWNHNPDLPPPSARAAVVLSAVGCGWDRT